MQNKLVETGMRLDVGLAYLQPIHHGEIKLVFINKKIFIFIFITYTYNLHYLEILFANLSTF